MAFKTVEDAFRHYERTAEDALAFSERKAASSVTELIQNLSHSYKRLTVHVRNHERALAKGQPIIKYLYEKEKQELQVIKRALQKYGVLQNDQN